MNNQKFPLRQSGEMIQRAIDGALFPDGTLTAENVPADAAAVGRKVEELAEKISNGGTGGAGGAEILPHGGSKEWLEINGDKDQLYQIDGYVWGFIESDGWKKSGVQYRVVSGIGAMTDDGGVPYLLRDGDIGTVYTYTAASGDVGVPVYGALPQSANEGDIVAVGGRKYRAVISAMQVPDFENYAKNPHVGYRWGSDGSLKETEGACAFDDVIPFSEGTVVRVRGLGKLANQNIIVSKRADVFVADGTFKATASTGQQYQDYTYDSATDTVTMISKGYSGTSLIKITGELTRAVSYVIITVNEEIAYRTETVVSWKDIGAYVPPVDAGWSETDLTYAVIDSIDGTAANGDTAVYSSDGYVYTYVLGSDWMKTSKYDVPSLVVDDELSETSTNAVSNRTVTAAIGELQIAANRHDGDIEYINSRIGLLENGGYAPIPSFWRGAVDACVEKVKGLQNGRNCVTFPFFSDNHQRNGYTGILIAHVMRECGMPYCICGGDAITNGTASTADSDAEFRAQAAAFFGMMNPVPVGKLCMALGNHEGYLKKNTSIAGSVDVTYTPQQQYDIFLRREAAEQHMHLGPDGTYYYVEDVQSRVRFVVLNTRKNELDEEQLAWFDETALEFSEPGWAVVIISHIPISNHYDGANIPNAADAVAIVNAHQKSTSPNRPDIIGWFSGHIHRDRIFTGMSVNDTDDAEGNPLGFTQVTITSDHTAIAYPVGQSPTTHPIDSSDKSHAIDFVTVNRDTRTVSITRLGIGEDRGYTY